MGEQRKKLFCFGLGYSAQALIRHLPDGWSCAGTCRDGAVAADLRGRGIEVHIFDASAPPEGDWLDGVDCILTSVPPDQAGDPVLRYFADAIAASDTIRWLGYLSTTGVYGNRDGGWVDEETPAAPGNTRTERRLAAENEWRALQPAAHVFRLAGIYGPGRSAFDRLRAGSARRLIKPGQVFSRIHVDDIAAVLAASIERPAPGTIYNVCDDEPAPPQDVIAHAAQLLGVAAPPEVDFQSADLTPMARSFYGENRRVRNGRIKQLLGGELACPSYREGLAAIRAAEIGH